MGRTAEGIDRRREGDRQRKREMRAKSPENVKANKRRYYERHKAEIKAKNAEYRRKHIDEYRAYNREYHKLRYQADTLYHRAKSVKRRYGLSLDQYGQLLTESGGRCAICSEVADRLCIDHDHATGVVRGLLCDACNVGLGAFHDDVARLQRAIEYLTTAK